MTRTTLLLLVVLSGCTDDSYVIGARCTALGNCASAGHGGDTGHGQAGSAGEAPLPSGTLLLELTSTGPERLPQTLLGVAASQWLIASDATNGVWPARAGSNMVSPLAGEARSSPWPFSDTGHAIDHEGEVAFASPAAWLDLSQGALALEVVFRAEPGATLLHAPGAGGLALDADGRLSLTLQSSTRTLIVSSAELVPDAWHHCLCFVDEAQNTARLFCNGEPGPSVDIGNGLQVGAAPTSLGAKSTARIRWAALGAWQAASFGPSGGWSDQARERFARLIGTYATGAAEPLPLADSRASGAYLDMTPADAPRERHLHPVGAHWPRIVCRPIAAERACGLLVEGPSSRPLAPADFMLNRWQADTLEIEPSTELGADGESLFALRATTTTGRHQLRRSVPYGDGPAVVSLFARAGALSQLRVEAEGLASVTFDLTEPAVREETGALLASAEPWGASLTRLSFAFDVTAGDGALVLTLLDSTGNADFAGSGDIALHLGGAELHFRAYAAPLPTFGAIQQADRLVYRSDNGNLPSGARFAFGAEVWLPDAPLIADAAVLNASLSGRYDQQINLFVSPQRGALQFWGLAPGATHFQLAYEAPLNDGSWHRVIAGVDAEGALLGADGAVERAAATDYELGSLDRVEIGSSSKSSGPLGGLIRHVRMAPTRE